MESHSQAEGHPISGGGAREWLADAPITGGRILYYRFGPRYFNGEKPRRTAATIGRSATACPRRITDRIGQLIACSATTTPSESPITAYVPAAPKPRFTTDASRCSLIAPTINLRCPRGFQIITRNHNGPPCLSRLRSMQSRLHDHPTSRRLTRIHVLIAPALQTGRLTLAYQRDGPRGWHPQR